MIFQIGAVPFPENQVDVVKTQTSSYNQRGQKTRETHRYDCTLRLKNPATVIADSNLWASVVRGADGSTDNITLLDNGGTSISHMTLSTASSLGGIRVIKGPDFPKGNGVELATIRTMTFTLEVILTTNLSGIVSMIETLAQRGNGGPIRRPTRYLNAIPDRQQVAFASEVYYTQRGRAINRDTWLAAPAPIWGVANLENEKISFGETSPQVAIGTYRENYPTFWNYTFLFEQPSPANLHPSEL